MLGHLNFHKAENLLFWNMILKIKLVTSVEFYNDCFFLSLPRTENRPTNGGRNIRDQDGVVLEDVLVVVRALLKRNQSLSLSVRRTYLVHFPHHGGSGNWGLLRTQAQVSNLVLVATATTMYPTLMMSHSFLLMRPLIELADVGRTLLMKCPGLT